MLTIYSISLGCPKNRVDTERALAALGPVRMTARAEEADCVFINTCGFIASAVEESVRVVVETINCLASLPREKRPCLVVAGCLVGRYGAQALGPELPEVDLLLDVHATESWGEILRRRLGLDEKKGLPASLRLLSTGPSYAWLKISDGCEHTCSFCTIPAIRGALRSTPAAQLREEAAFLLHQGVKELALVAQDLTAWGADLGLKHGLISLLEQLLPLPGLERLRLMYLYPAGLNRELLRFLQSAGPPFVPYFDVPLQHASSRVLARMGRPFARDPHEVIERIRDSFPDAALRTSLIVGFPGESEDDFNELYNFVEQSRFHHLGVFTYEAEEGAPAASFPGQIPESDKRRRRDSLMALQQEISEDILSTYVGQRQDVLVDSLHEEWPGLHVGRTWFQAPESDGLTYISGPGVSPGALVNADVIEASAYDLTALTDADDKA